MSEPFKNSIAVFIIKEIQLLYIPLEVSLVGERTTVVKRAVESRRLLFWNEIGSWKAFLTRDLITKIITV